MTPQEVFDAAVNGVIAQGLPSATAHRIGGFTCLYRGPNGLKCAAGHLFTDGEVAGCETMAASSILVRSPRLEEHDVLISSLQRAHDLAAEDAFREGDFDGPAFVGAFKELVNEIAEALNLRGVE